MDKKKTKENNPKKKQKFEKAITESLEEGN